MDSELMQRGRGIVRELELEGTTERWMAHRVVELMDRAQHARTRKERDAAAKKAEGLILLLWQARRQQMEAQASYLAGSSLHSREVEPEDYDRLARALGRRHAGKRPRERTYREIAELLLQANAIERELLRLLLLVSADDAAPSLLALLSSDGLVQWVLGHVARAFPSFSDLDLSKLQSAKREMRQALTELAELRQCVLARE